MEFLKHDCRWKCREIMSIRNAKKGLEFRQFNRSRVTHVPTNEKCLVKHMCTFGSVPCGVELALALVEALAYSRIIETDMPWRFKAVRYVWLFFDSLSSGSSPPFICCHPTSFSPSASCDRTSTRSCSRFLLCKAPWVDPVSRSPAPRRLASFATDRSF